MRLILFFNVDVLSRRRTLAWASGVQAIGFHLNLQKIDKVGFPKAVSL